MNILPDHTDIKIAWLLLFLLLVPSFAFAGVPLEVGLYKSSLLKLNKKMVLVTLANTKKDDTEKDAQIVAKSDKMDVEKRRDSGASNTNKFVTVEILSPFDLKIDGITIGSTSMIIWTKADGDEKPQPTFYDITVSDKNTYQPTALPLKNKSVEGQFIDISDIKQAIFDQTKEDGINVNLIDDTIFLTGTVKKEYNIYKAGTIAQSYAVKETIESEETEVGGVKTTKRKYQYKMQNFLQTESPSQILLEVQVAQVDKTSLKKLGFSFLVKGNSAEGFSNIVGAPTGGIAGNTPSLTEFSSLSGVQLGVSFFKGGIGAVLQALTTKGLAKLLAEPNLLVKSGQEGNFLAGSKFYYPIVTNNTADTKEITVGIKLKFKPEVLENGLINLKIDPAEVSSIAGTLAVNGYPIVDTREVRTSVELKDGESLVMAGMLQEETIKTMSKIPLLGDLPILGALFRSTQEDLKEKELVFFVTPRIVKPMARDEKPVLPTDKKLTPEQEDELKWMPLGR